MDKTLFISHPKVSLTSSASGAVGRPIKVLNWHQVAYWATPLPNDQFSFALHQLFR